MKTTVKPLLLASLVAWSGLWGAIAQAATPYVTATVEGALAPGVYGRIDIGNGPPPPLIYAQPVIIQRAPVLVQQQPLYLHVPPGQAKKWSRYCAKYNACGQPVYFVKVQGDDDYEWRNARAKRHGRDEGRNKERDRGNNRGGGD